MWNDLQFLNGGGGKIRKLGKAKIGKQGKRIGKILEGSHSEEWEEKSTKEKIIAQSIVPR